VVGVSHRDLVVVGASAGGVEALSTLVGGLPVSYPGTLLVVLHVAPGSTSVLPRILDRAGPLPAAHAVHGDPLTRGRVVVAPPDHHLLVGDGRVELSAGPRENGHRPAVDVLFRSAARAYGPRVVGVVLSGTLDDGSAGLVAVREGGGTTVVQDPDDALYSGMPANAIATVGPQHVLALADIPALLVELAGPATGSAEHPWPGDDARDQPEGELTDREARIATVAADELLAPDGPGEPSGLSCPDCHGVLHVVGERGGLQRFRCRVGHVWSLESLVAGQDAAVEAALWGALRALEERGVVARQMADRADADGRHLTAERFRASVEDARRSASVLRDLLTRPYRRRTAEAGEPISPGGDP
jgi:two-component system, chemotaxis family, protein-glutamate methylesterase/glutaminase